MLRVERAAVGGEGCDGRGGLDGGAGRLFDLEYGVPN